MRDVSFQTLKLKDNHTWKSKPGYAICVIDRGLVRFDYPNHWVVEPAEGAVHLHDQKPCIESCDLGVSVFPLPAQVIAHAPIEEMLVQSLASEREVYEQSEVRRFPREDMEIIWVEQWYIDKEQRRDARFRASLARGETLCLITMNYWANHAAGLEPVWDDVMHSLIMGLFVKDPTQGPVIH